MSDPTVRHAKEALRATMKTVRAQIEEGVRARAGVAIAQTLRDLLEGEGTVMAFLSFGSELPTDGIIGALHSSGHPIALPHIDGDVVRPVAYAPGDPLEHAVFGIREPAKLDPVEPTTIDAVLVPGLAFDVRGYRVGYGGGFYDRLLPTLRPGVRRIGIGFDAQVVDEVPVEAFDLPVEVIVTDERIILIDGTDGSED